MSDQVKPKGFSALLRPAMTAVLMVGTAGLGAAAATFLQSGKTPVKEENPSTNHEDPQTAATKATSEEHSKVLTGSAYDEFAAANGSRLSQQSAPSHENDTSSATSNNNSKHATQTDLRSDSEQPLGHDETVSQNSDAFSDEALGFHEEHSSTSHKTGAILHSNQAIHHTVDQSANTLTQSTDTNAVHSPDDHGDAHASNNKITDNQADLNSHPVDLLKLSPPSRQDRVTQQAINLMTRADEDLASGNYVQALQAYQSLRQKSDGVPGVSILFRLALCAEAAGRHAGAIEAYRKISGSQADPAWSGVARYGEARCLSVLKRHEGLQTDLLRRAILDETEFLPTVRGEVLHLIGRDLWREQTTLTSTDLLDEQTLIVPEWTADPVRLLNELPLLIHETPVKTGPREFQVLNLKDADPDETMIRLNCGMTQVENLIRNLVSGCGLSCEFTEPALEMVSGRTQQIHITEQSLALILDGITISSGIAWQLEGSVVRIVHANEMTPDELRQSRLNAAERILRIAVMDVPMSPQAGHSRLALSTLLFEQKRATDALQFLQVQIESSPRSVVETEAAFNLGKCLMILNQREEATQTFLRSIDASGGLIDVKIASYIFHSRILLEDNQHKRAIQSMMRGLSLSEGSALEPFAALHLASLYLMSENPQGANSVLMDRREELADGLGREGAAFLSSLSRFRAAVLADRREREGATVVSALTEFDASKHCGGHWAILVAGACEELGLSQESTDAYVQALRRLPPSDLRNKTVLRLAARYQAENQLEEARVLLATLTSAEADHLSLQARLRTAELSLEQNHPDEAIIACRALIDSTEDAQIERSAMQIMGRAFERQRNHLAAVHCFAGLLPEGASKAAPKRSAVTGGHHE